MRLSAEDMAELANFMEQAEGNLPEGFTLVRLEIEDRDCVAGTLHYDYENGGLVAYVSAD